MLQHCQGCTTAYAVGLLACPHCGQAADATVSLPADLGPATEPEPTRRRARRELPPDAETTDA